MKLEEFGWNSYFAESYEDYKEEGLIIARVAREQKNLYGVFTEIGEEQAILSDSLFMNAFSSIELPAVGDWILCRRKEDFDKLFIERILPRRSKFSRKGKNTYGRNYQKEGSSDEQIISANIDTVFLVVSMDRDFNLRKIERYLTLIWDSGSNPVIILNKADQCEDPQWYFTETESVSLGIPVHVVSALKNEGISELEEYLQSGKTVTLIGSSGAGKSSIINCILGEEKQYVSYLREGDKRGRHTTTTREMIIITGGGILIDNPGMRDIQLSVSETTLDRTFYDIVELEKQCRFRNCEHDTEPGCAIKQAIEDGELEAERFENYQKLQKEVRFQERRNKQRQKFIDNARSQQKHQDIKIKKHRNG
ncbi:MAG: ribosome small subunit-dependent GTPase A [Candidatus Stygibacter australis]|nr:ribosome small subunit-dependent GTPase A [Candidatus Stygibacter australis]MDP8323326.1 ribosome small subunit-dependent GTPase A [Candidatus Stygibacter australis]